MTHDEYVELLKDPRWDKKRKQILRRDGCQCRKCHIQNVPIHVHHIYYIGTRKPWEAPDQYLISLCKECHDKEHLKPISSFYRTEEWLQNILPKEKKKRKKKTRKEKDAIEAKRLETRHKNYLIWEANRLKEKDKEIQEKYNKLKEEGKI